MDRAVTGRSTYLRVMVVLGEFSTCGNVCFSVGYGASNFNGESIRQIKVGYRINQTNSGLYYIEPCLFAKIIVLMKGCLVRNIQWRFKEIFKFVIELIPVPKKLVISLSTSPGVMLIIWL